MTCPLLNKQPLNQDLTEKEVHIWFVSFNQSVSQFQKLSKILSQDERMRTERFHFEKDKKRFIMSRGILRMFLGFYLNIEPIRVQFFYGKNGKPAIANHSNRIIHFNMSSSDGLALYAFTRDCEIGVDIERIRDIHEMDRIAECFFSVRENTSFQALPKSKKKEGFFNCWTRKEAFIKAIGDGLAFPLAKFDVELVPGKEARLLSIKGNSKAASQWFLQKLKPSPGFIAAVAVPGQDWRFHCWQMLDWQVMSQKSKQLRSSSSEECAIH